MPGILYGQDADGEEQRVLVSTPRNVLEKELNRVGRAIENIVYDLEIDGETHRVLPRNLQPHPITGLPVSLNYLR